MANKKIFLILISLAFLSSSCLAKFYKPSDSPYQTPLMVGEKRIFVEIVSDDEKLKNGLTGRQKLKDDEGMLFDFRERENKRPSFWMKGMLFDIDIIWIKNFKITEITRGASVPRDTFETLPLYPPPSNIDMVLEVREGWTDLYNVNVGNKIQF